MSKERAQCAKDFEARIDRLVSRHDPLVMPVELDVLRRKSIFGIQKVALVAVALVGKSTLVARQDVSKALARQSEIRPSAGRDAAGNPENARVRTQRQAHLVAKRRVAELVRVVLPVHDALHEKVAAVDRARRHSVLPVVEANVEIDLQINTQSIEGRHKTNKKRKRSSKKSSINENEPIAALAH